MESRTISVTRLAHKPPREALREYRRGQSAHESRAYAEAAEHYGRAVAADEEWFEARVNLGVQYYRLGLPEESVFHLERAIEIDPSSAVAFSTLSAAYTLLGQRQAAERAAQQSVSLDPFRSTGRYIFGIALWNLGRTREAVDQLRRAASELEPARKLLERIWTPRGVGR